VVIYSANSKNNLLILITERGLIMKKGMKSILTPVLVASFMAMSVTPAMAARTPKTIDYVAFGDSVAAGVRGGVWNPLPEEGSDYGYTDNIRNKLEEAGVLGDFNEQFAISGATAAGLVEALKDPVYGPRALQLVQNAEIVTLDIGANDLLGPLYKYVLPLIANPSSIWYTNPTEVVTQVVGILSDITTSLGSEGLAIKGNIETILQNILNVNPNVKIYVMGYYNPLPALSAAYGVDLNTPIKHFNNFIIKKAISNVNTHNKGASITYIDTMHAMSSSDENLVPTDIHPTESGYVDIADEFWKKIELDIRKAK
jgi:lysophospholipase L1-like esterase